VPTPPGGGADILARQIAGLLEPKLKTSVVVENKPGGGGTIGVTLMTQAKPDGYTIGMIWTGPITTTPNTRKVPYTSESYTPLVQVGSSSYVMCVAAGFPAANAKELIEQLRQHPRKYTYGNDGVGGTMHLGAERIFKALGVQARAIAFGGAGETLRAFLGSQIDIYGGSFPAILPYVSSGKAKCLILTSADDNPVVPGASGLKALGLGDLETVLWWGLIAPKGLPADVRDKLTTALLEVAKSPAITKTLKNIGAQPVIRGPAEFRTMIDKETAAFAAVVKEIGLEKNR
jgi:tripartite-type tricarboxylate transporter receptor subunit TctC